jgi:raffinose/stachyose/melibiose transport system permease protein
MVSTFAYFPVASAFYHSFFNWNGDDVSEFIGLRNFREALGDPTLWHGFKVIGILVLANLVRMIPSVATAVAIHRLRSTGAAYLYKVLFVVPMIIPWMVTLLIWKFFFDPTIGVLNTFLHATGLMRLLVWADSVVGLGVFNAGVNPIWLGDTRLVIPALILWGFPWVGVVSVLIYLAGLQEIDTAVIEAGQLDGVTSWQKFAHIEFPLIMTQVRINMVLMIIGTLQDFGLILILLGDSGGPNGVALVPGLYMFRTAFIDGRAGYACAIGFILFLFILVLTEINNRVVRVDR